MSTEKGMSDKMSAGYKLGRKGSKDGQKSVS